MLWTRCHLTSRWRYCKMYIKMGVEDFYKICNENSKKFEVILYNEGDLQGGY